MLASSLGSVRDPSTDGLNYYPFLDLNPILGNSAAPPHCVCVCVCVCRWYSVPCLDFGLSHVTSFGQRNGSTCETGRNLTMHFCICTLSLLFLWKHARASLLEHEAQTCERDGKTAWLSFSWSWTCEFVLLRPVTGQQNQSASAQTHELKHICHICQRDFEVVC